MPNSRWHCGAIILDRLPGLVFPLEKYKAFSVLSINYSFRNSIEKAKEYAELAEQSAKSETSGLRYHKYLGVVNERDKLLDSLNCIAGSSALTHIANVGLIKLLIEAFQITTQYTWKSKLSELRHWP